MQINDTHSGWGTYSPRGMAQVVLKLCASLPESHLAYYSLTKALRTYLKRGRIRPYDVEVGGLRLRLMNRGNYSDTKLLFSPQFYDPEELGWLEAELAGGGLFLDVGGNIGAYSLLLAKRLGSRVEIHTVEPDAQLYDRMLFNVRQNGLDITLHATALSDYEGGGQLLRSLVQSGQNALASDTAPASSAIGVPVTTLLSLCRRAGIGEIAAMKIDVEGHEHKILSAFFRDAPKSLWPGAIVIEHTNDRFGVTDYLIEGLGYRPEKTTKRNVLLKRVPY